MDQTPKWTAATIRQTFLDFFASKGHAIVPSAPIVLKDDPTLMFTNAGMNQFKDQFLGNAEVQNKRVADTQKCLRVSGKHNDLEEVGHDTYHHTMFEMLGNWSFGDYFKEEAISWAWELLTEVYGLEKDRLYVTVFEGDASEGLASDEEARGFWRQRVAEERILNGNKKDNFWEMGASGPCGPCSEIHVDLRSDEERATIAGADLVNNDHPQVVEIWNLVFMQFNRKADGSLEKLPAEHVDTGMGFERLAMALQQKRSNYDTDVFGPLLQHIAKKAGLTYGAEEQADIAMRVIADHVRAVSFAIADGQIPSNSGAGYVIRRILRRAIRYGFSSLNIKEPFIYELVQVLSDQMGPFFPEIKAQATLVERVIQEEENSFLRTLEQGLQRLDQVLGSADSKEISGTVVFELYDTFGFPPDLTALILKERGFTYDQLGYESEMRAQKERARAAGKTESGDWTIYQEGSGDRFIGYDETTAQVGILRSREQTAKNKKYYQLVLDQTPFYPEGGGQVGDSGTLSRESEILKVLDTKKEHGLIVHTVDRLPSDASGAWLAEVDREKRRTTAYNHSATHLLHQALREVLGEHVEQKGSLVHPDYLRFDFSHFGKMSAEELEEVEELVNRRLRANFPLEEFRNISMAEAKEMGAMALFGEKYGDSVRAIKFGESVELCGGIHVGATGEIGLFKITSEGAVASGVRRIEALSGDAAIEYYREVEGQLNSVVEALKNPKDVLAGIQQLKEENAQLKKQLEQFQHQQAMAEKSRWKNALEQHNGMQLLIVETDLNAAQTKDILFQLKAEVEAFAAVVASSEGDKALLSVAFDQKLTDEKGLNAGKMVRELAAHIQGGGGGQAGFATAGGKNPNGISAALEAARNILNQA